MLDQHFQKKKNFKGLSENLSQFDAFGVDSDRSTAQSDEQSRLLQD